MNKYILKNVCLFVNQSLLLCGKHSWFLCDGSPTSPTASVVDLTDSKLNPTSNVMLQGWQLLSMAVSLFLPKQTVTWLLKVHLHRHADTRFLALCVFTYFLAFWVPHLIEHMYNIVCMWHGYTQAISIWFMHLYFNYVNKEL